MLAGLLPVRPLEYFVAGWSELLASASPGLGLALFGDGAGGVELAMAARHLLQALGGGSVTLIAGGGLLPGHGWRWIVATGADERGHPDRGCVHADRAEDDAGDVHDAAELTERAHRGSELGVHRSQTLFGRRGIRLGREEATEEEIIQAAEAAAATDFIESRMIGYDTHVGERGSRLSGGERQRIAIARAILKNAPILVLDEATSALDVETEARVKQAIDRLRQNRTTFIIAHRLSTIREADLVVFLDHGRIIEMGNYDQLSALGGRFSSLLRTSGLLKEEPSPAI